MLGETSCARTISYLDKGMVFIGSSFGDSQVVRLQAERDESGSYVKVRPPPRDISVSCLSLYMGAPPYTYIYHCLSMVCLLFVSHAMTGRGWGPGW